MEQFTDRKKAEERLSEFSRRELWFCPIITGKCRADCICYNKSRMEVINLKNETLYRVYEKGCTHVLICGELTTT